MASTVCENDYPQNHLLYGLLDDLFIYILNFLKIESIFSLKLTSKYLNKMITENNQCYHYFHMNSLETMFNNTNDNKIRYKLMESFTSIKSLETVINLNRLFPQLQQNEEYKKSKLFEELPPDEFYQEFVTKFLSKLHKLEQLVINGCFDDVAIKLPYQSRLQSMTIRNTESSGLLSSFFNRLLNSQFNIMQSLDNKSSNNDHDAKSINSWCKIFAKAGNHTLSEMKMFNFIVSIKTLFKLSKFENLSSLYIQYDSINYYLNKNIINDDDELNDSLNWLKSKVTMICHQDDDNDDDINKWNNLEPFIALLFKNILNLKNLSIYGEESLISHDNTLSLLLLYWYLYFQSQNLHSLNIRLSIDSLLKYNRDYDIMQIYNHIIKYPFKFDIKNFKSLTITLTNPKATNTDNDDNNNNDNNLNEKNEIQDIDDLLIKYGNASKQSEYIYCLPLSLQVFIAMSDRFEYCLNDYYSNDNGDTNHYKIETKYHLNDLNFTFESGAIHNNDHIGFCYGFMMAKSICIYHPRFVSITPTLIDLDNRNSELFIDCIESIAKWSKLLITKYKNRDKLKLVNALKISVSCISQISVKKLSAFCVGNDGEDVRLINALKSFKEDLSIKHIKLVIETMVPNNDRDKLRYYMRIQKHIKSIGFKIDLKPNENTQTLIISYNATK